VTIPNFQIENSEKFGTIPIVNKYCVLLLPESVLRLIIKFKKHEDSSILVLSSIVFSSIKLHRNGQNVRANIELSSCFFDLIMSRRTDSGSKRTQYLLTIGIIPNLSEFSIGKFGMVTDFIKLKN